MGSPSNAVPAPTLVPEFRFTARLNAPVELGSGPYGTRIHFEIVGGRAEGERFRADVLPGGGDWALVGPDGFARLDVRAQFHTDDGAYVYTEYRGLLEMTPTLMTALATGGSTEPEDQYFRSTPYFETGDERYAWMQRSTFVSVGRVAQGAVEYQVFRVS